MLNLLLRPTKTEQEILDEENDMIQFKKEYEAENGLGSYAAFGAWSLREKAILALLLCAVAGVFAAGFWQG